MARGDQLGRQWRIFQTLVTSGAGKSAAELAGALQCHPRTVYRDLVALQMAGFPIYTERVEGKNIWSLLDTVKHHMPVPFSLPELMALYFTRDMMKVFKGTSFGVFQGPLAKVRIWFSPEVAGYVKEKVWHESQEIVEQKDGSIIFEAVVAGTDEIRFWVMGWVSHAEVLEPEALREQIRAEAETLLNKYGRDSERQEMIGS